YTAIRQLIDLRYQDAAITSVGRIPYFENLFPGLAGNYNVLGRSVPLTATQAAYRRIAKTAVGGRNTTDYTFVQLLWDDRPDCTTCPFPGFGNINNMFFHPQYATFAAYSTLGTSDYNSFQLSLRKRFSKDLTFDFNYTLSHSFDIASGREASDGIGGLAGSAITRGAAFVLNPLHFEVKPGPSGFALPPLVNPN